MVEKKQLSSRRIGYTQKAYVGGCKIYLRTGEYEDGTLGEIFVNMEKEGDLIRSLLNCFCIVTSVALQYGTPLEEIAKHMIFTKFEPSGPVQHHDRIKNATSVIDYIFRDLSIHYLNREDLAHVEKDSP